jgi:hypothetical protein
LVDALRCRTNGALVELAELKLGDEIVEAGRAARAGSRGRRRHEERDGARRDPGTEDDECL